MKKIFIDSSVLVAACASKKGASALILAYCRQKKVKGYFSPEVIGEAKKNVNLKLLPPAKKRLFILLQLTNLSLVPSSSVEGINRCESFIDKKDAPILAAALKSPAQFLITLDKKHFFKPRVTENITNLQIITPRDFVLKVLKLR